MTAAEQHSNNLRECFVVRSIASGQLLGAIVACQLRQIALQCAIAGAISAAAKLTGREAKLAQAHGFIERLDNGYDTIIGDRGYGLSGGQQQRISLARALIRNPQLLILDEATSSLDTESERMIQEAIDTMHSMRTILVIAHRLSTIVNADQIILLEDGEILERGTQKELLAKGGRFAELWSLQDAN